MARSTHDEVLKKVRAIARKVDREAIASAFVASLGTKPGFWRAPLTALAAAAAVPTHRYRPFSAQSKDCRECGLLPEVEHDELSERGQILPGDLAGSLVVLEIVKAGTEEPPVPTSADVKRFTQLLATVGKLPPTARESALADALRKAKLVVGNRYDVRSVIESLGACGVLQTPEYPGFATAWTSFAARQDRPSSRVECDPPIAFWTAAHGVDATNVKSWFGHLGISAPKGTGPRTGAVAAATERMTAREKRAARMTEMVVGDVFAFTIGSKWYAGHVIAHHRDMGGTVPIVQRLDWSGRKPPTFADVEDAPPRVETTMMLDLWKRDDPKERWKTIGRRANATAQEAGRVMVMSLNMNGLERLAQI